MQHVVSSSVCQYTSACLCDEFLQSGAGLACSHDAGVAAAIAACRSHILRLYRLLESCDLAQRLHDDLHSALQDLCRVACCYVACC